MWSPIFVVWPIRLTNLRSNLLDFLTESASSAVCWRGAFLLLWFFDANNDTRNISLPLPHTIPNPATLTQYFPIYGN